MKKAGVVKVDIVAMSYDVTFCCVLLCMKDGTPLRNSLI
jgi:ribulose kinase